MTRGGRRLYRLITGALPREFRERHGAAMEATFDARLEAARGAIARWGLWIREGADLARTGVRLRWTARTGTRRGTMTGSGGWFDDLRGAARSLRRAPAITAIAVLTLGLGIGAATALVSAAERVLLRPTDLPEAERLVAVWRKMGGSMRASPDRAVAEQLRGTEGLFDHVLSFGNRSMILTEGGEPLPVDVVETEVGFFALADVRPVAGRLLLPEDSRGELMISETLWERLGRDPSVVGGTVRFDGEPFNIVGVIPAGLSHPSPMISPPDVWQLLPPGSEAAERRVSAVLARLAPGVSLEASRAAVEGINAGRVEEGATGEIELIPLGELEAHRLRDPVLVLSAAVLLLLALSWTSVAGLMLARGEARSREAAVRAALGASARRLTRHQLLEGLLITAGATSLGLLVARAGIAGLRALRPDDLRLLDGMGLNGAVLAFAGGAAFLATLFFGALPTLRTGRGWVAGLLRGSRSGPPAGARARRALVVVEVALSFTLLVAAVQVAATVGRAARRDVGFEREGVLAVTFQLPEWRFPEAADRAAANLAILDRVRAIPGVESVARGPVPPGLGIFFGQAALEGGPEPDPAAGNEVFFGSSISDGWLETMGIPLLRGRAPTEADTRSDESLWLLGEGLAERLAPGGDIVGRGFRIGGGEWGRVIGVVGEVMGSGSLQGSDYEQLWGVGEASDPMTLAVRIAGERPIESAPAIRAAIRSVDTQIPVTEISTVEDALRTALARERLTGVLLGAFAGVAAVLAVVGLYGVLAQVVRTRLPEYGIRLSLGAAPGRIFGAIVRGGVLTALAGIVLGVAAAVVGLRLLGSGLAGLGEPDPLAFAAAAVLLASVSLVAVALPARRAASADPVEVLRSD